MSNEVVRILIRDRLRVHFQRALFIAAMNGSRESFSLAAFEVRAKRGFLESVDVLQREQLQNIETGTDRAKDAGDLMLLCLGYSHFLRRFIGVSNV